MSKPVADLLEDIEFLADTGVGALEAAERTGFASAHAMEKWLQRHDRNDLFMAMKVRDPEGAHTSDGIGRRRFDGAGGFSRTDSLLAQANKSPIARTRARAQKIDALVAELASILQVEQAELAAKEEARKEVEKLEKQLAVAKARLRGTKPTLVRNAPAVSTGASSAEVREWAAKNKVQCAPTGRIAASVLEAFAAAHESEQVAS